MQSEMPLKRGTATLDSRMSSSFKQQLIFVTGKGGVGKSAVAAAVALKHAQAGKRTLLAELGYQSFYKDYFGLAKVTYQSQTLKPNLDLALWSGPECLREYALHLLKVEAIYKLFFENAVTRSLVNIAPGVSELSILGKITSGHRKVGPPLDYEVVVVDAFATGHFLAMLRAPHGMAQAIKFGPMGEQSRSIEAVLQNPAISEYLVVSIPEELPVIEALELSKGIHAVTGIMPKHLFNKALHLSSAVFNEHPQEPALQKFQKQLAKKNEDELKLEQDLKNQAMVSRLPFVSSLDPWTVVNKLAEALP